MAAPARGRRARRVSRPDGPPARPRHRELRQRGPRRGRDRPCRRAAPPRVRADVGRPGRCSRRLEALGAMIQVCPRVEGVPGDPAYHALRRAIDDGAVPFTPQGPDNGLDDRRRGDARLRDGLRAPRTPAASLDRLVVQVGGGALASSLDPCVRGRRAARGARAARRGSTRSRPRAGTRSSARSCASEQRVGARADAGEIVEALEYARTHRSEFMWPWEEEPTSVADGDLGRRDLRLGGGRRRHARDRTARRSWYPRRRSRRRTRSRARPTGIDVDHTGSAGLAGLIELARRGEIGSNERVAVLFTGIRRD